MSRSTHLHAICFLLLALHGASGASDWPLYNQQCRDDAGPPFADDIETFGPNGFYHDNHPVEPVLIDSDGTCAKPIEGACASRPTKKVAYMEGPIDCGGRGWYCRCASQSSSFFMPHILSIDGFPTHRIPNLTVAIAC